MSATHFASFLKRRLLNGYSAFAIGSASCLAWSPIACAEVQMTIPSHAITFSGNARGFWFVAPNDFVVTGLKVPTAAGNAAQSIALLRFPSTPAEFPQTSTNFETLFLTQANSTEGVLPTLIPITNGNVVGVLGGRGNVSSYGVSNFDTSINGGSVTLRRLGMQALLESTAPVSVWQEPTGSIGRVELYYEGGHLVTGLANPPEAGTVVCSPQIAATNATSHCSVSASPGWILQTVSGCAGAPSTSLTYTTGFLTAHCSVTASFTFIGLEVFGDGFETGAVQVGRDVGMRD